MIMITNKQKLIEFARATGETDPEGKVSELLRAVRGAHPEGRLILLDEKSWLDPEIWDPSDPGVLKCFIKIFVRENPNVKYLMIVGGPEVVPFYYTSDPTGDEDNIATDSSYGDVIGSDYYQDIAVGRIVGINIENMISLIRRINPQYCQTSSSTIVSCGDRGVRDTTDAMKDSFLNAGFSQSNILYLQEDDLGWGDKYINGLPNQAIISHQGHGSPFSFAAAKGKGKKQTWQWLTAGDVRCEGLGTTNPVIYGGGCHTALIEEGSYSLDGGYFIPQFAENTISMSFLEMGAASFVGSTRLSYFHPWFTWYSEIVGRDLIEHLAEGNDIGSSLMDAKNSVGGWFTNGNVNRKTWLTHVLYGDPKFNPVFPNEVQTSTSLPTIGSSIDLTIDVQEYSRITIEEHDVISIPEGRFLFNPGYPLVSILVKEFKLEGDHQLTGIELLDAEIENIENVRILTDQVETSIPLPKIEYPIVGLYPGYTYGAGVYQHLDGSKTLQLIVAPLQYDKANRRAHLYKHMKFRLVAEPSLVSATPAYWSDTVELGGFARQEFEVRNLGPSPLEIELEKTGRIEEHVSFDIDTLTLLPGEAREITATFTATEGIEVGTYVGEILVRSTQGGQSMPVTITVFAPAPRVEVVKEFKPSSIHEKRRGAVMPQMRVANVGRVEISNLEIVDELLENWGIKNLNSISVSYFDSENTEYGVGKKALEVSLIDGKLRMYVDFSEGVEVQNGNMTGVIYSLKENESIGVKYPMHPIQKLQPGLYESWISAKATSPEESKATMKTSALLEVTKEGDG
jgi:hypothetical protein